MAIAPSRARPEPASGGAERLAEAHAFRQRELLEELATRHGCWFDLEMDKLHRWAETAPRR